jgi:hypothetical protein
MYRLTEQLQNGKQLKAELDPKNDMVKVFTNTENGTPLYIGSWSPAEQLFAYQHPHEASSAMKSIGGPSDLTNTIVTLIGKFGRRYA